MFKKLHIHIGLRIIKTSFSAALAMLICDVWNVEFPSLAVVAAVVILQPTLHQTIEMSKVRVLGATVGSILGLLFLYISPVHPMFEIFIGVLIILAISNMFSVANAGVLGIMAFASIIAFPESTYLTAINRVINTFIGAGTSILINFIFPAQPLEKKFDDISAAILKKNIELLDYNIAKILDRKESEEINELDLSIVKAFSEASNTMVLMKREQRFIEHSDSFESHDENFSKRYGALWNLHVAVLYIQTERKKLLDEELCFSPSILEKIQGVRDVLKGVTEDGGDILSEAIVGLEEEFNLEYNQAFASEDKEGAFLTVFLTNLLIISENINEYKASFVTNGEKL